jgi:NADH:ubiquinone oxidoreductase subunit H
MCLNAPRLGLVLSLARLLLLAVVVGLMLACEGASSGTNLLTLTGVSPRELGISDELEIQGNGLPEGKPARVAFRGDLYHPGSRVERDVEIVARTTTSSPRSLSVVMTEQLRTAFVGTGDAAKHTTFRGEVEVSFTPKKTGSAPITGTLSDVVLDIEAPLVSEMLQRQRDEDARLALEFLGITLRGGESGECCEVGDVSGRAQASGLGTGDVLVDLDGVTIRKPYDLVPSGRSRAVRLTYRRAGAGPNITREVDVQGYRSAAPSELGPALGVVSFFSLWLLLTATRLGRPLEWLTHWLSVRLRESRAIATPPARRRSSWHSWLRASLLGLPEESGWGLLTVMILIATSVIVTLMSLRVDLVSPELDLAVWILLETVSLIWAAALAKIALSPNSIWQAIKAVGGVVLHQIPLFALTITVVAAARSLRLSDIVSGQETTLRTYHFFESPPLLLLTLLAVAALIPEIAPAAPFEAKSHGRFCAFTQGLSRVLSGSVHLWSASLLITLLSFGGYRVPLLSQTAESASYAWQLVGVVVWLTKAMALVLVIAAMRHVTGSLSMHDAVPTLSRYGLGLVALGVLGARGWSLMTERYALGWIEDVTAWVLFSLTLLVIGWAVRSAFVLASSTKHEWLPNPWV